MFCAFEILQETEIVWPVTPEWLKTITNLATDGLSTHR